MADTDQKIMPAAVDMPDLTYEETLKAGSELRIISIQSHIKVLIGDGGLCEVFGRELPLNEPLFFHQGERIAIFCWRDTKISITGEFEKYDSEQTPMHIYLNLHCALNRERNLALQERRTGPNLLVTGSPQSGKSTLCKILVNYALKLGWQPILVDVDLNSTEISPPGSISAAMVTESTILPSDNVAKNSITYFHGDTEVITNEFLNKQMQELAEAVRVKQENDLAQFMHDYQLDQPTQAFTAENEAEEQKGQDHMQQLADLVKPVFPEMFASGTIINGFTPDNKDKQQTETLMKAIENFRCGVVLVIDNEQLERDITNRLAAKGKQNEVVVVKVPKTSGISSTRQTAEEQEASLFNEYQVYFRGRHYQAFAKNEQERARLGLEESAVRNELDPQPINLPVDRIKIFEIIGRNIPLSALPIGMTQPEETTFPEEIRPQEMERQFPKYKHRILAAVSPKEIAQLKQLEARIAQNPNNDQLKEDFKEVLLKSCTLEFMQIRAFRADDKTQKKYLEVVRTCANRVNETAKAAGSGPGAAAMGGNPSGQGEQNSTISGIFGGSLQTGYFVMSKFTLKKMVF